MILFNIFSFFCSSFVEFKWNYMLRIVWNHGPKATASFIPDRVWVALGLEKRWIKQRIHIEWPTHTCIGMYARAHNNQPNVEWAIHTVTCIQRRMLQWKGQQIQSNGFECRVKRRNNCTFEWENNKSRIIFFSGIRIGIWLWIPNPNIGNFFILMWWFWRYEIESESKSKIK